MELPLDTRPSLDTRYTKVDLCQTGGVTARLIDDWVQLGLLDRPDRHSRGRHGMAPATWPWNQRELLVQLVKLRGRTSRIAPLCNVPVWMWLRYGNDYVPLRQVRRALATWGKPAAQGAKRGAEAAARQMARQFRQPGVETATAPIFVDAVMNSFSSGVIFKDNIRRATNALLGVVEGTRLGPPGAQVSGEIYAELIATRLHTVAELRSLSDALFVHAREIYAFAEQDYALRVEGFAQDPAFGHLHRARDTNTIINTACSNLLDIVGLLKESQPPAAPIETTSFPRR